MVTILGEDIELLKPQRMCAEPMATRVQIKRPVTLTSYSAVIMARYSQYRMGVKYHIEGIKYLKEINEIQKVCL